MNTSIQNGRADLSFNALYRLIDLSKSEASGFEIQVSEADWLVDDEKLGEVAKYMKITIGFGEKMEKWKKPQKVRQYIG